MIDLPSHADHDPRPLSTAGVVRLVVAAASAVAVQVSIIDPVTTPGLRHVDLPLTLASVLILARPTQSATIGLIFGLMVDASAQRLFGIHCVAFALLGPVARSLPTPAWRRPGPLVVWQATAQGLVAATVVAGGQAIAAGGPTSGALRSVISVALVVGVTALPLSRLVGLDAPLGRRRPVPGFATRPAGRGLRPGPIRPLGP